MSLLLTDFDFDLPPDLVAQTPPPERGMSRLLDASNRSLKDRQFPELLGLFQPNDLLVFNNTKVVKARLHGHKTSGGAVEVLFERLLSPTRFMGMCRASHTPKEGADVLLGEGVRLTVTHKENGFFTFDCSAPVMDVLAAQGKLPLPPYITHSPGAEDETRYQTVYAKHQGAVAAPTAGLHFTEDLLARLPSPQAMLTLHVGAGTFLPVRDNDLSKHQMHSEVYHLDVSAVKAINDCKTRGGRVIAVGTTSLRALEAYANTGVASGETDIFITPGYEFKLVDALITNFHLPKSTLLMLVSAFSGMEFIKAVYQHAIASRYRFFSYGDALFLEKHVSI